MTHGKDRALNRVQMLKEIAKIYGPVWVKTSAVKMSDKQVYAIYNRILSSKKGK